MNRVNVLNLCEHIEANAPWPHTFEQETLEHLADSLRHYYLLSKRLERRIAELETTLRAF